jgi:hypothetical protein
MNVRTHRPTWRTGVAAAALAACLALLPAAPLFAGAPLAIGNQPTLSVAFQASRNPRLPDFLTATMQDHNARPLGEEAVHFYLATAFLGQQWVHVGQATTDATGTARIAVALEDRAYEVRVVYRDADGNDVAEATRTINGPQGAPAPIPVADRPLQAFQFWMPRVIGGGVVLIWLLLIGITLLGIRGIRRGRTVVERD